MYQRCLYILCISEKWSVILLVWRAYNYVELECGGPTEFAIPVRREAAFIKAISLHTLGFVLGLWSRPRPYCVTVGFRVSSQGQYYTGLSCWV